LSCGRLRVPGPNVAFPYTLLFLALLVAYMVYSEWAHLDSRLPIAAALVLLVVTAAAEALGASDTANLLAEFVFFLLAGGVVLLLVDHLRDRRKPARLAAPTETPGEATDPAEPG
jgi:hypothetical protein